MSLAETVHARATNAIVTAIGISRQNAMAACFMFHEEAQLVLFGSISFWNNGMKMKIILYIFSQVSTVILQWLQSLLNI